MRQLVRYLFPLLFLPSLSFADGFNGKWSLGAVIIQDGTKYIEDDPDIQFFPSLRYTSETISFGLPNGLTYHVLKEDKFGFDIYAKPRFSRLPEIEGIKRNLTIDAGLSLNYNIIRGTNIKGAIQKEAGGEHGGFEASLEASQFIPPVIGIPLIATAGMKFMDSDLSNYLYGVNSSEISSGLPMYNTGSSYTPYLSLTTFYALSDDVSIFGNVSYNFLPDEIRQSPLLGKDSFPYSFIVGIEHNF